MDRLDRFFTATSVLKTILSLVLVMFSVVVVSTAIMTRQTNATSTGKVPPPVALVVFWSSLVWLSFLEGGLNCMVGLQNVPQRSYETTHPRTFQCTSRVYRNNKTTTTAGEDDDGSSATTTLDSGGGGGGANAPPPSNNTSSTSSTTTTATAITTTTIYRFIVGRQYLDLSIVFLTSFMVSSIPNASVLNLPAWVNTLFLQQDLAVILCTIVFGQLISIINCTHRMLDFMNNYVLVLSTNLALVVESTGILHAVYFVQILFTQLQRWLSSSSSSSSSPPPSLSRNSSNPNAKDQQQHHADFISATTDCEADVSFGSCSSSSSSNSNDAVTTTTAAATSGSSSSSTSTSQKTQHTNNRCCSLYAQKFFFWIRVVMSLAISIFAIVSFTVALYQGNTTLAKDLPMWASLSSLAVLVMLGGFMEALQIALFAVKHLDQSTVQANARARRNCEYLFFQAATKKTTTDDRKSENINADDEEDQFEIDEHTNRRLQSFLIGRQILQTVIMFMVARIINIEMKYPSPESTMFGVSPEIQRIFFDSGLLNALVTTIFASLSWRVTANAFPMLFLGSPISIWIIRLCLLVDATGICDAAWVLAKIPAYLVGYKPDEYYLNNSTGVDNCDDIENALIKIKDSSSADEGDTSGSDSDGAGLSSSPSSSSPVTISKGHRSSSIDTTETAATTTFSAADDSTTTSRNSEKAKSLSQSIEM